MDLRRISAPLEISDKLEVVTVAEVKAQARVRNNLENDVIASHIEAAYDYLSGPNGWLGRCALLTEEWEFYFPSWHSGSFELPMRPFVSLSEFSWVQPENAYVGVDTAIYRPVWGMETFGSVHPVTYGSWPYFGTAHQRAYRVRFKAGFGTEREDIPSGIRLAIKMLASDFYANREATVDPKNMDRVNAGLNKLAGRWRIANDHS